MAAVPVLEPRQVIGILTTLGFTEVRQRGSHKRFRPPDGRATTVPVHPDRDLLPLLVRQIARDIRLTVDDFVCFVRYRQ